jgi:hypothetical protein
MARGNWNPEVVKAQPRCRLCRHVVRLADLVRLDGVAPAHRICATERGRSFTNGAEIHSKRTQS